MIIRKNLPINACRRKFQTKAREGFGSFHSEDIDLLIRKQPSEYQQPELYDIIKTPYYTDKLLEFKYGFNSKKSLYQLNEKCTFLNHGGILI